MKFNDDLCLGLRGEHLLATSHSRLLEFVTDWRVLLPTYVFALIGLLKCVRKLWAVFFLNAAAMVGDVYRFLYECAKHRAKYKGRRRP